MHTGHIFRPLAASSSSSSSSSFPCTLVLYTVDRLNVTPYIAGKSAHWCESIVPIQRTRAKQTIPDCNPYFQPSRRTRLRTLIHNVTHVTRSCETRWSSKLHAFVRKIHALNDLSFCRIWLPISMRYHSSFSHRLFPRLVARGISNGFTTSNCRCEERVSSEIYGSGATARARSGRAYVYICTQDICTHSDIYRACRKPLNLAADSHEIIGREIHLGNFQYSHSASASD